MRKRIEFRPFVSMGPAHGMVRLFRRDLHVLVKAQCNELGRDWEAGWQWQAQNQERQSPDGSDPMVGKGNQMRENGCKAGKEGHSWWGRGRGGGRKKAKPKRARKGAENIQTSNNSTDT